LAIIDLSWVGRKLRERLINLEQGYHHLTEPFWFGRDPTRLINRSTKQEKGAFFADWAGSKDLLSGLSGTPGLFGCGGGGTIHGHSGCGSARRPFILIETLVSALLHFVSEVGRLENGCE
jgi:hypothetical protein